MIHRQIATRFAPKPDGCDDVALVTNETAMGAVVELAFCHADRCFYVTVGGCERLRSDIWKVAWRFFINPPPD